MISSSSTGKFRDFPVLFFPVLLISFSSCLYLLVEKLLFARFSTLAMEAALAVAYVVQIFQLSSVALVLMAQVYVAKWHGAREWKSIGPCIWQLIWFSLISLCLTFPIGSIYGKIYLRGLPFEEIALPYLYFLLAINFFYPLGMALSCFFIGRGKTLLVMLLTIGSQMLKVILAYFLIPYLGMKSPLWGLYGGAISTLFVQSLFCCTLIWVFLLKSNAAQFGTREFRLRPKLFWESIHPGLLRAINRILSTTCGASIAHLMASKGDQHLIVFSIGGVIFLFLPFLSDAIGQTQAVIVSQILGGGKYSFLPRAFRSGYLWSCIWIFLVAVPLLIFPEFVFHFLFPAISLSSSMIRWIFLGLWASFSFFTLLYVPLGYILAFKDMYFSLFMGGFGWINGYLLIYFTMEKMQIASEYFWLILSLMHLSSALMYFVRAKILCSRVTHIPSKSLAG